MSMICRVVIGYFDAVAACVQRTIIPTRRLDEKQVLRLQGTCDDLFDIEKRLLPYLTRDGLLCIEDIVVRRDTYKAAAVAHHCFGMETIDHAHRCVIFPAEGQSPPEREPLLRFYRSFCPDIDEQQRQQMAEEHLRLMREQWEVERGVLNRLAVVSNMFRAVSAVPKWRRATSLSLARWILAERAFEELPILGDALEEEGCTEAELLAHCREQRVHKLGCWVVDLLLGWEENW